MLLRARKDNIGEGVFSRAVLSRVFVAAIAVLLAASGLIGVTTFAKYSSQEKAGSAGLVIANTPPFFDLYYGSPSNNGVKGFYANPQLTLGVKEENGMLVAMTDADTTTAQSTPTTQITTFDQLKPIKIANADNGGSVLSTSSTWNYSIWMLATYDLQTASGDTPTSLSTTGNITQSTGTLNAPNELTTTSYENKTVVVYPTIRRWNAAGNIQSSTADTSQTATVNAFNGVLINIPDSQELGISMKISGSRSAHTAYYTLSATDTTRVVEVSGQNALDASGEGSLLKIGSNSSVTLAIGTDHANNKVIPSLGDQNLTGGKGGSVYVSDTATFNVADATFGYDVLNSFAGNTLAAKSDAAQGGAIYIAGSNATVNALNCVFESNTAANGGGAVYSASNASSNVVSNSTNVVSNFKNCTFTQNKANQYGGAIYNTGSGNNKLIDCTFTGNKTNGNTVTYGGAVALGGSAAATLTITGGSFVDNEAGGSDNHDNNGGYGGAIYINNANATLNVNVAGSSNGNTDSNADSFSDIEYKTTFRGNSCRQWGGAININSGSSATINAVYFTGNTAKNRTGGAVSVGSTTTTVNQVDISNCSFYKNTASSGGAIGNGSKSADSTISVSNCSFEGNNANRAVANDTYGKGGAIALSDKALLKATDCTFTKNTAYSQGGAILCDNGSGLASNGLTNQVEIERCTFTGNSESTGGGGGAIRGHSVTICIKNSSFDGNTTPQSGGAINGSKDMTLENCTFTNNKATGSSSQGGAVYLWRFMLTVKNSYFNGNTAGASGGAVYSNISSNTSGLIVQNSYFENNTAGTTGGALSVVSPSNNFNHAKDFYISNSTFVGNTANGEGGGAIYTAYKTDTAGSSSSATDNRDLIENCLISKNVCGGASGVGGGVWTSNALAITGSDIIYNQATAGSALYLAANSTNTGYEVSYAGNMAANEATGAETKGGAVYVAASGLTFSYSTGYIYNNSAAAGVGGIYAATGATLTPDANSASNNVFGNYLTKLNSGGTVSLTKADIMEGDTSPVTNDYSSQQVATTSSIGVPAGTEIGYPAVQAPTPSPSKAPVPHDPFKDPDPADAAITDDAKGELNDLDVESNGSSTYDEPQRDSTTPAADASSEQDGKDGEGDADDSNGVEAADSNGDEGSDSNGDVYFAQSANYTTPDSESEKDGNSGEYTASNTNGGEDDASNLTGDEAGLNDACHSARSTTETCEVAESRGDKNTDSEPVNGESSSTEDNTPTFPNLIGFAGLSAAAAYAIRRKRA